MIHLLALCWCVRVLQTQERIRVAAWYLRDALFAKDTTHLSNESGQSVRALKAYALVSGSQWNYFMLSVAWAHLLMILLEPPGEISDRIRSVSPYLSLVSPIIELIFLGVHALNIYYRYVAHEVSPLCSALLLLCSVLHCIALICLTLAFW